MLSFEIMQHSGCKEHIQIYCDEDGLSIFIQTLKELERKLLQNEAGHVHLCAPSAGGKILSDKTPFGADAIGEVIITTGGD